MLFPDYPAPLQPPVPRLRVTGSRRRVAPELREFERYRDALIQFGADSNILEQLDLDNRFLWAFKLEGYLATARHTFSVINERHFSGKFSQPEIVFCRRSTGGFFDPRKQRIGISMAMTIECGEAEFMETVLHEIAHMEVRSHSPKFYEILSQIGGTGRKAPRTLLLELKRKSYQLKHYPILVYCPNCGLERRYRTRRALRYACAACCKLHNRGKFDIRFLFREKPARVR